MEETPLAGGWVNNVVRVGDTVRRSTGPWTPAVHALLRHLETVGFDASPRVLGIDEQGREVLTFIEGDASHAPWPDVLRTDAGLAGVARLLRRYHDAVAGFQPPADAVWRSSSKRILPEEIICHGDFAPWNLIWRGGRLVGVIDWDFALPAPPIFDVAQLAWTAVPLSTPNVVIEAGFTAVPDDAARLRVICDAYGSTSPSQVVSVLEGLQLSELTHLIENGNAGLQPWASFLTLGERERIAADIEWLRDNRERLV